jgi:deoxyribonuclease-4
MADATSMNATSRDFGMLPAHRERGIAMPLFGAHLSVAGGYWKAAEAAQALDCQTLQIFSKAPSQWRGKAIASEEADQFKSACRDAKLAHVTVHDSYLINLAAPTESLWEKSIAALTDELRRAELLGAQYLVAHPGAHLDTGEEAGIARIVAAVTRVFEATADAKVMLLLETTAGMGTTLGHRFEQIAAMLDGIGDAKRVGVCLDTCHIFAAGYPLDGDDDYAATFASFDKLIGLKRLKVFHVNDSVKGLGCRVDRHAGIGLGSIGDRAFRRLVTDPRFAKTPMILETPKEAADKTAMDPINLAKLRDFAGA